MKVAFFVYPSAFQSPGGEILLLKTKEALEQKGVSIRLFNQWEDKLKDFDILHVFGSFRDCVWLMKTAGSLGVKIALSPIFWSTLQRTFFEYGGFCKRAQMVLGHIGKIDERKVIFLMLDILKSYFEERKDVAFAFLFGSAARGKVRKEGDVDVVGAKENLVLCSYNDEEI